MILPAARSGSALLATAILLVGGCTPNPESGPARLSVSVQLPAGHRAEFAGFYAAALNGHYAADGLRVQLLEGGQQTDVVALVTNGPPQFGVTSASTLILARADGRPVRAIATIYQRDPLVWLALAGSGISRPEQFAGKRIRVMERSAPAFLAMMARVGVEPDRYTRIATSDLSALFTGRLDVADGLVIDEVLAAKRAGYKLNVIYPDDYGVHFYADTIFTSDRLIAEKPDVVRRFLRATLRGWSDAVRNPGSVGATVQHFRADIDVAHQNEFMAASLPLIGGGREPIGSMTAKGWADMTRTMREQRVLSKPIDVTEVYTQQFLRDVARGEAP